MEVTIICSRMYENNKSVSELPIAERRNLSDHWSNDFGVDNFFKSSIEDYKHVNHLKHKSNDGIRQTKSVE